MLKVDDVMRFYFIFFESVFISAVLYKLPKTFWFILVNHIDSSSHWFFYIWTVLCKFISFIFFLKSCNLIRSVENNRNLGVREIHVAIGFGMVDSQAIIIVNHISSVFIRSMRNKFKDEMT